MVMSAEVFDFVMALNESLRHVRTRCQKKNHRNVISSYADLVVKQSNTFFPVNLQTCTALNQVAPILTLHHSVSHTAD